ncbi:MAG: BatA domain-containing protein [Candidatus Coproplasma sp.]
MSFIYPLGLLGLIAVPVLIIIYIIKNKYTEQVISATYLWTLSEKFLKRRNPINRLTGIISLILQILMVVLISFSIAQPVFTVVGGAGDYCFILDGSGSMNMVQTDGKTRLELGKDEIRAKINESGNGSAYTLIYVGDSTSVVFENTQDKDLALTLLDEISPSDCANGMVNALVTAQKYFDENPSIKTYLITDKSYQTVENAEVITISANEENYAVSGVTYKISDGKLNVSGELYSYESDAVLHVGLYLDGEEEALETKQIEVKKLEAAAFEFVSDTVDFSSLKVAISESDALDADNYTELYNQMYDSSYKTLIVSETPFFIRAALASFGNVQIDVVSPEEYDGASGYGLYVFDSFSPSDLPRNSAVWFINPVSSIDGTGFSVQSEVALSYPEQLQYNNNSSTRVNALLANTVRDEIYVAKYTKCGLYRSFTTLLSCQGNPVVFAGSNSYGNREVVFSFNFSDSDFTMSLDYVALVNNLMNYTFPSIVDSATSYYCGDVLAINVLPNCESVRVDTPRGDISYIETGSDVVEFTLNQSGVYTVTLIVGDLVRQAKVFCNLPVNERFTTASEQAFVISGTPGEGKRDGVYDDLMYLFIILAVLFIADWMVYCYEQYQLR